MPRTTYLIGLCLLLLCGLLACAPKQVEPPNLSAQGYQLELATAPSTIWLTPPDSTEPNNYLGFGEIVAQVRDNQGNSIDGVPVRFEVAADWADAASLRPQRVVTHDGSARAIIIPNTSGVVRVTVQIDDITQEAEFVVQSPHWNSNIATGARGLPYPPWTIEP